MDRISRGYAYAAPLPVYLEQRVPYRATVQVLWQVTDWDQLIVTDVGSEELLARASVIHFLLQKIA